MVRPRPPLPPLVAPLLALFLALAGCDGAAAPEPPPEPAVRVDSASVHYWGNEGTVALRITALTQSARVRAYHPLCARTLFDEPVWSDTTFTVYWAAPKCPPSPYGYEMVQAVLSAYAGDVLATGSYKVVRRYGSP